MRKTLVIFLSLIATRTDIAVNEEEDKANSHVEKAVEFVRMNYCYYSSLS